MPQPSRMERLKALAASLLGPSVTSAQGSDAPGPVIQTMQNRQNALNQSGGNRLGGMFDIIYRKRKEREDALRDLGAQ